MTAGRAPVPEAFALVVTADLVLRAQAVEGLGSGGFACDATASAAEGLAWIEEMRRDYALVVIDVETPGPPAAEIRMIATTMRPSVGVIACASGGRAPGFERRATIRKPALASEFARAATRLRDAAAAQGGDR